MFTTVSALASTERVYRSERLRQYRDDHKTSGRGRTTRAHHLLRRPHGRSDSSAT